MQPQRSLFDPRVATKDEFVAKFNQMSRCARAPETDINTRSRLCRVIKAQKQRVEEMQGTCEAHERNIQQLQVCGRLQLRARAGLLCRSHRGPGHAASSCRRKRSRN
jgi:hypothetical protein